MSRAEKTTLRRKLSNLLLEEVSLDRLYHICFDLLGGGSKFTKVSAFKQQGNQFGIVELLIDHYSRPIDRLEELLLHLESYDDIKPLLPQYASNISVSAPIIQQLGSSYIEEKDIAIVTVIPVELSAAYKSLEIIDTSETYKKDKDGKIWLFGEIFSEKNQRDYSLVLTCIGEAGNTGAASITTEIILKYRPRVVILMGIAAGVRSKVKIGDVVFSERVVAYEKAALRKKGIEEPRPDIPKWFDSIKSDVNHYMSTHQSVEQRIDLTFQKTDGVFPSAVSGQEEEYEKNVARKIGVKISTIASGEKLLRDPNKLKIIREKTHGKTEAGEMEAAGFAEVCQGKKVDWLVVRGISDFGDEFKDDRFHEFASKTAATVLADFLKYGLDLGDSS